MTHYTVRGNLPFCIQGFRGASIHEHDGEIQSVSLIREERQEPPPLVMKDQDGGAAGTLVTWIAIFMAVLGAWWGIVTLCADLFNELRKAIG